MPGGVSLAGLGNYSDQGVDLSNTRGVVLTSNASANVKGSYSQIVASTPYDASSFIVSIGNPSANGAFAVDIAIGAAGSEVIIASNLSWDLSTAGPGANLTVPIYCAIPAGTRIAARCQDSNGSRTVACAVTLLDGSPSDIPAMAPPQTYGISGSNGTLISTGTVNTKPAWTQLVAATTYDIGAIQPIFGFRNGAGVNGSFLLDLAVGASGSEVIIASNLYLGGSYSVSPAVWPLLFRNIKAGSRVAARAQCNVASNFMAVSFLGYTR